MASLQEKSASQNISSKSPILARGNHSKGSAIHPGGVIWTSNISPPLKPSLNGAKTVKLPIRIKITKSGRTHAGFIEPWVPDHRGIPSCHGSHRMNSHMQ